MAHRTPCRLSGDRTHWLRYISVVTTSTSASALTVKSPVTIRTPYVDLGGNYFDNLNEEAVTRSAINRLKALGYEVSVTKTA